MYVKNSMAFILIAGIVSQGCATTHQQETTDTQLKNLRLSCTPTPTIRHKSIKLVSCTIENLTAQWVETEVTSFRFLNPSETAKIVSPEDTVAFVESYQLKQSQDDYNLSSGLAIASIVGLAAMIVGANNGSMNTVGIGAATIAGSAAIDGGTSWVRDYQTAQYGTRASFGSNHLLAASPIKIPANLFVRKNLLVEIIDQGRPPSAAEICLQKECLIVKLSETTTYSRRLGGHTTTSWD